jgi:hypothetical protein
MALSELTHRLVTRHCERYCGSHCPPHFERQVRLTYRIDGDDVWLLEKQPVYRTHGVPAIREVPLARVRFVQSSGCWHLHHVVADGRLRRYAALFATRDFLRVLREVDRDPHGVFWQRVNGASLRWCSARGRCASCEERYARIVGAMVTGVSG